MREAVFLGVDQGTRSSKAIVCNQFGEQLYTVYEAVTFTDYGDSRIEQDPSMLLDSIRTVLNQALEYCNANSLEAKAIGLACQRSGVCAWSKKDGTVLHPLITWADTRTQDTIRALGEKAHLIWEKASLPPLAHYAGGKIALLQKQFSQSEVHVATLDSFLLWNLIESRPYQTDDTMAARTMLYSIVEHQWNSELLGLFSVDRSRLPEIRPSLSIRGAYQKIPFAAMLGDQQAALYALQNGSHDFYINFGSIASILVPTGEKHTKIKGFVSSIAYSLQRDQKQAYYHLLEGVVNACGCVIDYLLKEKYIENPQEIDSLCHASAAKGSQNVSLFSCGGTGSPDWIDTKVVIVEGWDKQSRDDYVRAAIESIAGFIVRQIEILRNAGLIPENACALVSGGLSQSRYLLQQIANQSGITIQTSDTPEATALGAAYAAQQAISAEVIKYPTDIVSMINPAHDQRAKERYSQWHALLKSKILK